jgi:N-acetylglucosaminyldiphosphoundecaprenol N-acetyl-beta-D-mannosaminyltransferase
MSIAFENSATDGVTTMGSMESRSASPSASDPNHSAPKKSVLGIGVDATNYDSAVEQILDAGEHRRSMIVTALAVHGVMTGVLDAEHNYRLNQFDLVCPDGQPVRWALNLLHGSGLKDRVYGPELTLRVCEACAKRGVGVFLFGGTEEMLSLLSQKLRARFPALKISGMRASRFRTLELDERDALVDEINSSGAGVCFVGLGCPRQETFAYEMRDRINMPMLAVGAAFAFHAGMLPQAPPWMQKNGLEWFYRLVREPRRLWRRYAYLNPLFLTLLVAQRLGLYGVQTNRGRMPNREALFG